MSGLLRPLLVTVREGHERGCGAVSLPQAAIWGIFLFFIIKFFRRDFEGRTKRDRQKRIMKDGRERARENRSQLGGQLRGWSPYGMWAGLSSEGTRISCSLYTPGNPVKTHIFKKLTVYYRILIWFNKSESGPRNLHFDEFSYKFDADVWGSYFRKPWTFSWDSKMLDSQISPRIFAPLPGRGRILVSLKIVYTPNLKGPPHCP